MRFPLLHEARDMSVLSRLEKADDDFSLLRRWLVSKVSIASQCIRRIPPSHRAAHGFPAGMETISLFRSMASLSEVNSIAFDHLPFALF
jgi:hypothetical protein